MLQLVLEMQGDERHYDMKSKRMLPRSDSPTAILKARKWAMERAGDAGTATIFPTAAQRAAGWSHREAPSAEYPWVEVTDREVLLQMQAAGQAPESAEIDEHTIWVAFAGQRDDRGRREGWQLSQASSGSIHGSACNCHVFDLSVEIEGS